jgi:hypothetical protein
MSVAPRSPHPRAARKFALLLRIDSPAGGEATFSRLSQQLGPPEFPVNCSAGTRLVRHHGLITDMMFDTTVTAAVRLGPGLEFLLSEVEMAGYRWTEDGPRDLSARRTHRRQRPPALRGSWWRSAFEIEQLERGQARLAQRQVAKSTAAASTVAMV